MGRIRSTAVKRTGKKLLLLQRAKVALDFSSNKKVVDELVDVRSKKLRNVLAGYLTKIARAPPVRRARAPKKMDDRRSFRRSE
ncbi:MAG TPA: 30S ribosomal protein S17e [Candidatus Nanoarchaeia archaeon]|nr:30S ribosomal protein S17e [Candidatus Nanoarchaeia archaeon]